MNKKFLKNVSWGILICSLILFVIGLFALYSATQNTEFDEFKKQILWFLICIPIVIITMLIDYKRISKYFSIGYGLFTILLVAVLFAPEINGANSWFKIGSFLFQPSEFSKIFVVMFLSYILVKFQQNGKAEINKIWKLGVLLAIVLVPFLLIAIQPDYGTAMAYIFSMIFILFVGGIDKKYIIIAILLIAILLPILYFFVLPEHAKTRIDVFLNPNLEPRGAGYNIIQSKIAIGAGELFGMGLLKGNQTQLGFLYPKTTDFIFAVIGEEMGFVISAGVVITYIFLLTKSIYVAKTANDELSSYIAAGISGIFFFHVLENIGMTVGLLPITGVPLPFISYGGSALITNFICIGILLSISGRRQKSIFVK